MLTVATSVSTSSLWSEVSGSFTSMPCTSAVVVRMKITSSTHARSSSGVMLMSAIGPPPLPGAFMSVRRRQRRLGQLAASAVRFAGAGREVVDHEGGLELRGEVAEIELERADLGGEHVVREERRDR